MLKQIVYNAKQQPMVSAVSIIGTGLAIFVVMVVMILHELDVMPIGPEADRPRMMYVGGGEFVFEHEGQTHQNCSGSFSLSGAREMLDSLQGVQDFALFSAWNIDAMVEIPGKDNVLNVVTKKTDAGYWRLLDFEFLAGNGFDEKEVDAGLKLAILDESTARHLFGSTDVVGSEFLLDFQPHRVKGVVRDVTPFATRAYANVWLPFDNGGFGTWGDYGFGMLGEAKAMMLMEPGASVDGIKQQLAGREAIVTTRMFQSGKGYQFRMRYIGDIEQEAVGYWDETVESAARKRWMLYLLLLFIPAVNMSVMTQSRLRRRTSEIGVRRAFGCTRSGVMKSVIVENMAFTMMGALLGFALSVVFLKMFVGAVYEGGMMDGAWIPLSAVFDWRIILWLLGLSFILNLLSSLVPAWRAARMNPVAAINNQLN